MKAVQQLKVALVLFTSYNHLHFVSENICIDNPFKSQGDMLLQGLSSGLRRRPILFFWQPLPSGRELI